MSDATAIVILLVLILGGLALYFLPWLIALGRSHKQSVAIFFLTLLAGWSVVGWVAAFVWSCVGQTNKDSVR